jgi:hypothetical protein
MVAFATPRFSVFGSSTAKFRLAALAACGASLILFHHAELLAEKVYDDLCLREGIAFARPTSAVGLVLFMVVFSTPILLARSRALVIANLALSLVTAGAAVFLLFTASDQPYDASRWVDPIRTTRQDLQDLRYGVLSFCCFRSQLFSLIGFSGR